MLTLKRVTKEAMALCDYERKQLAMDLIRSLSNDIFGEDDGDREAERRNAELIADPSIGMTLEELDVLMGQ